MVLRIILGAVYTAMVAGQLASWSAMPEILAAYRVVDGPAAWLLTGALVLGELVAGVWFLARPRSLALAPVWGYTAVSLVWAGLGLQAYVRGLTVENCGCFGLYLSQPLSWFVLAQDGLLLMYAAVLIRSGLRARKQDGPATSRREGRHRVTVPASWHGAVLAESDDTVVLEGNHYLPVESMQWEHFTLSGSHTVCPWKGIASYHTVIVGGVTNQDAAWYYAEPLPLARKIKDWVAFWRGVTVGRATDRGLAGTPYWTNREAIEAATLPESLLVLGGGAVGLELAQAYFRFGVWVTVVEALDRILAVEEPESSTLAADALAADGITIRTGAKASNVFYDHGRFSLTMAKGEPLDAERLLVATGRRANLAGLGLDTVGLDPAARHRGRRADARR
jgi:uncharacterized protein (DUF427 family)